VSPGAKTYRRWEGLSAIGYEAQSPAAKLPEVWIWCSSCLITVPQLDLGRFYAPMRRKPEAPPPFDPAMMVVPCCSMPYCVGGSFRAARCGFGLRNAIWLSMAIVGQERPRLFARSAISASSIWRHSRTSFVHVVRLAGEAEDLGEVGQTWSTDGHETPGAMPRGTKAMSYGYMTKAVERLREEIEDLGDGGVTSRTKRRTRRWGAAGGDELPAELARREQRLATIEARPCERFRGAGQAEGRRPKTSAPHPQLVRPSAHQTGKSRPRQSSATGERDSRRQGPQR